MEGFPKGREAKELTLRKIEHDRQYLTATAYVMSVYGKGWAAKEEQLSQSFEKLIETLDENQLYLFDDYHLKNMELEEFAQYANYRAGLYVAREYPEELETLDN